MSADDPRSGRARLRAALTPLVAVVALVAILAGVRALVVGAPQAPSLAPDPAALERAGLEVGSTADPASTAALRASCRRGAREHAATVERLRAEHVAGGLVDVASVVACPAGHDGLEVRLVGEVVGDVLVRSGGVWLTVNDDAHALTVGPLVGHGARRGTNRGLAVWAPDGTHEDLGPPGRAGRRGDLVVVVGTVVRGDAEDGGGLTLRAVAIERVLAGEAARAPVHREQAIAALLALGAVALAGARRALDGARRALAGTVGLSAGRAGRPAARTDTAPRWGRPRSRDDGRRRPDARDG